MAKHPQAVAIALISLVVLLGTPAARRLGAQSESPPATEDSSDTTAVERGKYLVHHVAMCIYCHTPKRSDGSLVEADLLRGAPMPVKSPFEQQRWALKAPSIAGLPGGWSENDLAHFLETREPPTEHMPRPPMPPFRMNPEDAKAVAAYLKSLR
ncbi:MAG: cytochrome C [Planctomycetota bacterium]|nr:MAG: cytochrome C [Planctomycetota bacterium]